MRKEEAAEEQISFMADFKLSVKSVIYMKTHCVYSETVII